VIRVRIEAASHVVRAGLTVLIEEQPDMSVVGGDADTGVDVLVTTGPDAFGPGAKREQPRDAPTVWLTDDESAWSTARWREGLRAVLASAAPPSAILAAIRAAAAGLVATAPEALLDLLPDAPPSGDQDLPELTTRETEVLSYSRLASATKASRAGWESPSTR
jgi:DNA-binding NarL/FixJ family response regulator